MKNILKNCKFIGIIITLFLLTSITSISTPILTKNMDDIENREFYRNILYVGGSGPGNYTKIQDALDNATEGDTVYVYSGIYYESISIEGGIKLIGQNTDSTIIDGLRSNNVISVRGDGISIIGFTITNGYYHGISSRFNFCFISNNKIINTGIGLFFGSGYKNIIKRNSIMDNSNDGIIYYDFYRNVVCKNNFINNTGGDVYFKNSKFLDMNKWRQNYWGKPLYYPKRIWGVVEIWFGMEVREYEWYNIDFRPALRPYNISKTFSIEEVKNYEKSV